MVKMRDLGERVLRISQQPQTAFLFFFRKYCSKNSTEVLMFVSTADARRIIHPSNLAHLLVWSSSCYQHLFFSYFYLLGLFQLQPSVIVSHSIRATQLPALADWLMACSNCNGGDCNVESLYKEVGCVFLRATPTTKKSQRQRTTHTLPNLKMMSMIMLY